MDPGEAIEQTIIREVKEETGLDVDIVHKIGEYVEKGIKDEIDYEYYPTCFVVKRIGGKLRKQEKEIQEIELFNLNSLPHPLAFEHDQMIKDYQKIKEKEGT